MYYLNSFKLCIYETASKIVPCISHYFYFPDSSVRGVCISPDQDILRPSELIQSDF